MRVAILDDYSEAFVHAPATSRLRGRADVTVFTEPITAGERAQRLLGVEAIIALRERTRFDASFFESVPGLRLLSQTGTGVNHVDLEAATRAGVLVATAPGGSGSTTAELAIGLMLSLMRQIPQTDRALRTGQWTWPVGRAMEGKTAGFIGLGRVGGATAKLAGAFGMEVLAWSRSMTPERAAEFGASSVSLEDLLRRSDIVSIHVPLNTGTRGLLDEAKLRLMRPDAYLINTSRGPVVQEDALVKVLREGVIGGAGLDVYDEEPLPINHPLLSLDNVVLTPHLGWPTDIAYADFTENAVRNIELYLDGALEKVLNPNARQGMS